ncbi:hypothetical protein, partial [Neisseria meningitidis]|uniref:hypothetical protein n=1 Tax=Neisseria meningitidis TaxID=487 RepID=UPI001E3D3E91
GNLHRVIPTNLHPVIPSKTENQNQKPKIPSFPHNRNLTVTVATEPSFPPLFVIPAKAGI